MKQVHSTGNEEPQTAILSFVGFECRQINESQALIVVEGNDHIGRKPVQQPLVNWYASRHALVMNTHVFEAMAQV